MRSQIRVARVGAAATEELKNSSNSIDAYTFDLTLEEEQPLGNSSELLLSSAETPYAGTPDSNDSVD